MKFQMLKESSGSIMSSQYAVAAMAHLSDIQKEPFSSQQGEWWDCSQGPPTFGRHQTKKYGGKQRHIEAGFMTQY